MPGLQPGWTRKDTQHFPLLTMNEKLSMLFIPEALRHYIECQDFSLSELERIHNISLYKPWPKNYVCYISQKRSGITLNARTSAWINQKRYTTFPYINHDQNTKYVIYHRNTQALHCYIFQKRSSIALNTRTSAWINQKDTQHFPILAMTEKLSMLYIPEALRHYIECQDFSLGELDRIHSISLYKPWPKN